MKEGGKAVKNRTIAKRIIETRRDRKGNAVLFDLELAHVPAMYRKIAEELDGQAYTESCFAFQYKFVIDANRYFVNGVGGNELYYLDENGVKHYMDYKIPKNVIDIATDKCNAQLKKMGIKRQRKSSAAARRNNVKIADKASIFICKYRKELFESGNRRLVYGQLALF